MLVDTIEGIVNTDHIVRIEPSSNGRDSTIKFVDGTTRVTREFDIFERACGTIVPAQPGFDVVLAFLSNHGRTDIQYTCEAVIAFRIVFGAGLPDPMPVTVSGEPRARPDLLWTLRQPNGACVGPDESHDDLDAFKAHCERWAEKRLKQPV